MSGVFVIFEKNTIACPL